VTVQTDIFIPISENMEEKFNTRKLKKENRQRKDQSQNVVHISSAILVLYWRSSKIFSFPFTSRNAYRRSKGCFHLQCQGCYIFPLRARNITLESNQGNYVVVNRIEQ